MGFNARYRTWAGVSLAVHRPSPESVGVDTPVAHGVVELLEGGGAGGFTSGYGGGVAPAETFPKDPSGERWVFQSYATATEVSVNGREVLMESLRLDQTWPGPGGLAGRMGATHALAVVVLIGPRCATAVAKLKDVVEPVAKSTVAGAAVGVSGSPDPAGHAGWLLASFSDLKVPQGDKESPGVVARIAGPDTDSVYAVLRAALEPLGVELGAAPFAERGLA